MSTAFAHLPIVTDGLVFSIDAYNTKSYVSGDTVCNNLSYNTLTGGTLTNGVGYSDNAFSFDGTNEWIDFPNNITSNTGSIEVWFKIDSTRLSTDFEMLVSPADKAYPDEFIHIAVGGNWVGSDRALGYAKARSGVDYRLAIGSGAGLGSTYKDDNWHQCVVVIDGVENSIYMDGVKQTIDYIFGGTLTTTEFFNPGVGTWSNLHIGIRRTSTGDQHPMKGGISNVKIYNKPLTSQQVLQNYNALKGRFI